MNEEDFAKIRFCILVIILSIMILIFIGLESFLFFIVFAIILYIIVVFLKERKWKKCVLKEYDNLRDEISNRKNIISGIKLLIKIIFDDFIKNNSRRSEIENFTLKIQNLIESQETKNPRKYRDLKQKLIQMDSRKHPFEYFFTRTQKISMRELYRVLMKEFIKEISNKKPKIDKKPPNVPSLILYALRPNEINEENKKIIHIWKNYFEERIRKIDIEANKDFIDVFSEKELKLRKRYNSEEVVDSYIKLYSLYELYLHFIGGLLDINNSNFNINKLEHTKNQIRFINSFKEMFKNDSNWKIFYEFAPNKINGDINKKREARHINVHENAILKNGKLKGWYVGKVFISEIEFKNNRKLLTTLLFKVSESLGIYPDDNFFDEFIKI